MTKLDSIIKSKDITLPTKAHIVKAMVFPVVVYRYESWTVKKAEPGRIDSFKLWCWRRLLRVPWTARRAKPKENQPCIFIGRIDAEAEAAILWPPDSKSWLIGKDPGTGKDLGREEKRVTEDEIASWTQWTWIWANSGRQWKTCCSPWDQKDGTGLSDWTTTSCF